MREPITSHATHPVMNEVHDLDGFSKLAVILVLAVLCWLAVYVVYCFCRALVILALAWMA